MHRIFCLLILVLAFPIFAPEELPEYRAGYNNRRLYGMIIRDLETRYGKTVNTAYGNYHSADHGKVTIDEGMIDEFVFSLTEPKEQLAVIKFLLAHEYFHVFLEHPASKDRFNRPVKEIKIHGSFAEARKYMEKQADYLAARELLKDNLPTAPMESILLARPKMSGGEEYPSAEERVKTIRSAKVAQLDRTLFDNAVISCRVNLQSVGAPSN